MLQVYLLLFAVHEGMHVSAPPGVISEGGKRQTMEMVNMDTGQKPTFSYIH